MLRQNFILKSLMMFLGHKSIYIMMSLSKSWLNFINVFVYEFNISKNTTWCIRNGLDRIIQHGDSLNLLWWLKASPEELCATRNFCSLLWMQVSFDRWIKTKPSSSLDNEPWVEISQDEWDIAAQMNEFGPPSETKPFEKLSEYDNLDEEWPYRMIPLLLKFDHPLKHMICFHLLIDHHDIELVLKSIYLCLKDSSGTREVVEEIFLVVKQWHNIQPFDDNVARDKYEKSVQLVWLVLYVG